MEAEAVTKPPSSAKSAALMIISATSISVSVKPSSRLASGSWLMVLLRVTSSASAGGVRQLSVRSKSRGGTVPKDRPASGAGASYGQEPTAGEPLSLEMNQILAGLAV